MKNMRKINEFAELCRTSAKTLRFYDQAGVLSPEYVDPENGYRYYADDQAEQFSQITELKQAGFTLEEIRNSLGCTDDPAVLEMLRRKEAELSEACSHCRDMIRVYEARVDRGPEGTPCRVHRLTEKQRIILDDGKSWITLPCRREDMEKCCGVLEGLLAVPGYVNISVSDMKMRYDRDRPAVYLEAEGEDAVELIREMHRQLWEPEVCQALQMVLVSMEFPPEGYDIEYVDTLTTELLYHLPENVNMIWGAALGTKPGVQMMGIF